MFILQVKPDDYYLVSTNQSQAEVLDHPVLEVVLEQIHLLVIQALLDDNVLNRGSRVILDHIFTMFTSKSLGAITTRMTINE